MACRTPLTGSEVCHCCQESVSRTESQALGLGDRKRMVSPLRRCSTSEATAGLHLLRKRRTSRVGRSSAVTCVHVATVQSGGCDCGASPSTQSAQWLRHGCGASRPESFCVELIQSRSEYLTHLKITQVNPLRVNRNSTMVYENNYIFQQENLGDQSGWLCIVPVGRCVMLVAVSAAPAGEGQCSWPCWIV